MKSKENKPWLSGDVLLIAILFSMILAGVLPYAGAWVPKQSAKEDECVTMDRALKIAVIYNSAKMTGGETKTKTVEGAIRELQTGISGDGRFAQSNFRIGEMSPSQVQTLQRYLALERPSGKLDLMKFLNR